MANKALRAAARKLAERDDVVAQQAQAVYIAMRQTPPEAALPDVLYGPLEVVATTAVPVLRKRSGLPPEEDDALAAYLLTAFIAPLVGFDREHYERWKEGRLVGAAEASPAAEPG